jgi:hypothetical protein
MPEQQLVVWRIFRQYSCFGHFVTTNPIRTMPLFENKNAKANAFFCI